MNYTLLIYETPAAFARRTDPDERSAYEAAWPPYAKAIREAGIWVAGAGLESPETATTIRVIGDDVRVQDGPCADTKEQLGGFFIIDVASLDIALEWAARCPSVANGMGSVEVRPNLRPVS